MSTLSIKGINPNIASLELHFRHKINKDIAFDAKHKKQTPAFNNHPLSNYETKYTVDLFWVNIIIFFNFNLGSGKGSPTPSLCARSLDKTSYKSKAEDGICLQHLEATMDNTREAFLTQSDILILKNRYGLKDNALPAHFMEHCASKDDKSMPDKASSEHQLAPAYATQEEPAPEDRLPPHPQVSIEPPTPPQFKILIEEEEIEANTQHPSDNSTTALMMETADDGTGTPALPPPNIQKCSNTIQPVINSNAQLPSCDANEKAFEDEPIKVQLKEESSPLPSPKPLAIQKTTVEDHIRNTEIWLEAEDYQSAIIELELIDDIDTDALILFLKGYCLIQCQETKVIMKSCDEVSEHQPSFSSTQHYQDCLPLPSTEQVGLCKVPSKFESARHWFEQAKAHPKSSDEVVLFSIYYCAQCAESLNQHETSLAHYHSLLTALERSEMYKHQATGFYPCGTMLPCSIKLTVKGIPSLPVSLIYFNQATCLRKLDRLEEALRCFQCAITSSDGSELFVSANIGAGNLYYHNGQHQKAITHYLCAINHEQVSDIDLAWYHGNLANAYLSLCEYKKAHEAYQRSLSLTVEHDPSPKALGRAYNILGTYYQATDQLDEAQAHYDRALALYIFAQDTSGQSRAYGNIGNIYMLKKNYARAIPHYSEVCRLTNEKITVNAATHNMGCAYYEFGMQIYTEKGLMLTDESIKHLQKACKQLWQVWRNISKPLQSILSNFTHHHNRAYIEAFLSQHQKSLLRLQDSLITLEKEEAALTISAFITLPVSSLLILQNQAPGLITISPLIQAITNLKSHSNKEATQFDRLINELCCCFHDIRTNMLASYSSPTLIIHFTDNNLCAWLVWKHDGQLLIKENHIYLAKFDNGNVFAEGTNFGNYLIYNLPNELNPLPVYSSEQCMTKPVVAGYQLYGCSLNDRPKSNETDVIHGANVLIPCADRAFIETCVSCVKPLLQEAFKGKAPPKATELNVVLNEFCSFLPLEILPFDIECLDGPRLFDNFVIKRIPSLLTYSLYQKTIEQPSFEPALLVAPNTPKFILNGERHDLGPLPYAVQEVQHAAWQLNTQAVIGDNPTHSYVSANIEHCHLIHFAAHATSSGELFLSTNSFDLTKTLTDNYFDGESIALTKEQIEKFQLGLRPLVILSGCSSSKGKITSGEIGSLENAFLCAGAGAVISNKLSIPDESAFVQLDLFYHFLVQGIPALQSLQKASSSLQLIPKYRGPHCWSTSHYTGANMVFKTEKEDLPEALSASPSSLLSHIKDIEDKFIPSEPCSNRPTVLWLMPYSHQSGFYTCLQYIKKHHSAYQGGVYWLAVPSNNFTQEWQQQVITLLSSSPYPDERKLLILDAMAQGVELGILRDSLAHLTKLEIIVIAPDFIMTPEQFKPSVSRWYCVELLDLPLTLEESSCLLLKEIGKHMTPIISKELLTTFTELVEKSEGDISLLQYWVKVIENHAPENTEALTKLIRHLNQHMDDMWASSITVDLKTSPEEEATSSDEDEDVKKEQDSCEVIEILNRKCLLCFSHQAASVQSTTDQTVISCPPKVTAPFNTTQYMNELASIFQWQLNLPDRESNILTVLEGMIKNQHTEQIEDKALQVFNEMKTIGFLQAYPMPNVFAVEENKTTRMWRINPLFYNESLISEIIDDCVRDEKYQRIGKDNTFISWLAEQEKSAKSETEE